MPDLIFGAALLTAPQIYTCERCGNEAIPKTGGCCVVYRLAHGELHTARFYYCASCVSKERWYKPWTWI